MTASQADRIARALKQLAEFEQFKLADLLEEKKEIQELERNFDADQAADDAEFKAVESRVKARRKAHRETLNSIAESSKATSAAISENYRRQDELFERLAALSDKLI